MQSYYMPNKRTISRIDYIVCIKRLDTSDDEREGNCNLKGWDNGIPLHRASCAAAARPGK